MLGVEWLELPGLLAATAVPKTPEERWHGKRLCVAGMQGSGLKINIRAYPRDNLTWLSVLQMNTHSSASSRTAKPCLAQLLCLIL